MQSYVDLLTEVDTTEPDALHGIWVQKRNNKTYYFNDFFTSHIN